MRTSNMAALPVAGGRQANSNSSTLLVIGALLLATANCSLGRGQISLDSSWCFRLGDPVDVTTNVTYYPEISDLAKLDSNEVGAGTNTETYMESIRVDIFATHAGENVSFVQTNYDDSAWRQINLPHDWAVELPFNSSADGGHGYKPVGSPGFTTNNIGWYRHTFTLPANYAGQSLWLQFDGVYRNCLVWLNGHILGRNVSGYESFYFDVTPYANPGGTNVLVMRVDANRFEGWFYEGAGIYRHVWLTAENPVHVAQWGTYAATTSLVGSNATVTVQTEVTNQSGVATVNGSVTSSVLDANSNAVVTMTSPLNLPAGQGLTVTQPVSFTANLWSPQTPYLYQLVTTISNQNSGADVYHTPFGVRTVVFDATNGLFLNGRHIFIQGMANHQDHAGVGSALPDRLQYFRIERLKEMGVTGYRTAHNEPASAVLDACDQLGMLVLDENRRFGTNAEPLSQLSRLIRRDRNHPSVFAWSLCNEETTYQGDSGTGAALIQVMQNLVHSLDPSRKCTAAVNYSWNTGFSTVLDVMGFNYEKYGNLDCFHRDFPTLPGMGTEVGALTTTRGKYYLDTVNDYMPSYDIVYNSNEYGLGYAANYGQPCETWPFRYSVRPWVDGGFNWTGFAYRGEETPFGWPSVSSHWGIMDLCGFPKDVFYVFQANWTVKPVLHVMPHWNWAAGTNVDVWVFGNCDSVELFTNGVSLGRKLLNMQNHLEWIVPWKPGTLQAIGYSHGLASITNTWTTSVTPTTIALWPDRNTILADGRDVSVVTIAALDAQGNVVPTATNTVSFTVGGGAIIGVGNGNPNSHDADKGTQILLWAGLAQVIVQSTNVPGSITLTGTSSGLPTTNLTIVGAAALPVPAAPTGVTAISGNTSVTVSWDIVPGATTYNLWRSTMPGGPYTTLVAGNIGGVNLGYTDTNVANNTTYYYVVTANGNTAGASSSEYVVTANANGASSNSAEVNATPVPMVSNLAAAATNGAIQLAWSGSPGTTYNIKRSATCGGPYTTIASSFAGTNYTDWSVSAGQTNYYIVTITNAGTESIPSNEAGASVSNLPWPWVDCDVGAVDWAGSASYSNGQFTITGSGRGIPDSASIGTTYDYFHFVYTYLPNTTNGYIQARIVSVQNTAATAKAGVMIRENFYADSQYAMADLQSTSGYEFSARNGDKANPSSSTVSGSAPGWVRLTRTNNTFRAYSSPNGSTWTAIGSSVNFTSMGAGAYVGLVVCSSDNGFLNTSVLTNVSSTFLPANTGPTLTAIPDQTVNVGQPPPATAAATDTNSPPPILTFNLLNAPANATLIKTNSTNAAFNWRPLVSDASTTNLITLKVADNGSPNLSATQSFLVTVNPLTLPFLSLPAWSNGQFSLMVTGQPGPDYALQATTNLMDWSTLWITNSPPMPLDWIDTNTSAFPSRFYRLLVGPPLL
jgi:beta-galactosidase